MEKHCIVCEHFQWRKESMWGMGSTQTGPMMEGGDAACAKGHYEGKDLPSYPEDEDDFRKIILMGVDCPDYSPPDAESSGNRL
jgi:hypothetical protein